MDGFAGSTGGQPDVRMDFDVVQAMADGFQSTADQLRQVDRALEVAIAFLQSTAFVGVVGSTSLAAYLENIQPNVARLAATCAELHNDLVGAIASLRDGDYSGSQRFVSSGSARSGSTGSSYSTGPAPQIVDGGIYRPGGSAFAGNGSTINTVFINGILNDFEGFKGGLGSVGDQWGTNGTAGIYNHSENVLVDSAEGLANRIGAHDGDASSKTPAVESLKTLIRQNAAGDRKLEIVGHSQGGAIISEALDDLYREDPNLVNFVEVTTFGSFGFEYPPGPDYHFYVYKQDLIPLTGQALGFTTRLAASPDEVLRYYSNLTVLDADTANPLTAHSLDKYTTNLEQFQQEEQHVQSGGIVSRIAKQAAEIVESQTIPLGIGALGALL